MNATKLIPNYSYEDYCQWEGRWELIEGLPFAMSPSPSLQHQWVTANIIRELGNALKNEGCKKCRVYDFIDIKIDDNTIVQPDCSIVCKPTKENFLDFPPALVVEVLSKATALKDRHTKFSLYEQYGIKYYLIVDHDKKKVEIYFLEKSKYVKQVSPAGIPFTFNIEKNCALKVHLENFWE